MCHIYLGLLACTHPFHSPIHHCLQTESVVASEQTHQALVNDMLGFAESFFTVFSLESQQKWLLKNLQAMRKAEGCEQASGTTPVNQVIVEGLFTEQSSSVQ